jgi:hypothetical protein
MTHESVTDIVTRGVKSGFPFIGTWESKIYCGFRVPMNGNPGFRKSGARNLGGLPVLRNEGTRSGLL